MIGLTAAMVVLVVVHLVAGWFRFGDGPVRRAWLSAAGGISVAFVFLELLPELAESQDVIHESTRGVAFLEDHVYLVALAGLATFYGLESWVRGRRARDDGAGEDGVFWVHIAAFAVNNALIGYLMVEREPYVAHLPAYTIAMSFHFFVTDYGLRDHHDDVYHRKGRWILSAAIVLGFMAGLAWPVSEAFVAVVAAVVAGAAILNVMKEELPEGRDGSFPAFAGGVGFATVLLLLT